MVSVILGEPEVALAAATACLRPRRAGGLLPPADGAGGHVAAAAHGAGVAVRGRDDVGAHGAHGSAVDGLSVLVVTGTDTGVGKTVATAALACHARLAGIDVAVCKPVQPGPPTATTTSPTSAGCPASPNCTGWQDFPSRWRPRPPRQRAGMRLPTRGRARARWSARVDRPGRLTLVEGAGGLLVEIGDGGVTLRDLAVDLAASVLVVARAGPGHVEPCRVDAGSACLTECAVRRPGDRRHGRTTPGVIETGQPRGAVDDGAAASRVAGWRRRFRRRPSSSR